MTYFNKKEDVLDIEITKYGQFMLSQGQFRPVYYAFFDDDVLYDSLYGWVSESQNSTESRIEETPRLKAQYLYSGVETNYNLQKLLQRSSGELIVTAHDADNMPGGALPLGKSKYGEQNYPAWAIQLFDGEISSVAVDETNAYMAYKTTPSVNLSCQVFTGDMETLEPTEGQGIDGLVTIASEPYDDGTFLILNSDELLLRIEEKNTDFQTDNFEIEVYEVETSTLKNGTSYSHPKRLLFSTTNVIDDVASLEAFQDNEVEFYMTILADQEIPSSVFCNKVPKELRESYFMGSAYECVDDNKTRMDVYVKEEDSKDVC